VAVLENLQDVPGYADPLHLVLDDRRSEAQRGATIPVKLSAPTEPTLHQVLASLSAGQLRAIIQQGKEELRNQYQLRLSRLKRHSKVAEVKAEQEARCQPLNTTGVKKAELVDIVLNHLQDTKAFRLALKMRQPARKPRARLHPGEKQIHSYLTSLAVKDAVDIIITYHQRIQVDNSVIKMLKTYLTLENWPSHNLEAVKNHVLMVCLVFNMIQLFRSQRGRSFSGQSIARLQKEFLGQLAIAIYAGQEYVILTFEEFVQAVAHSVGIVFEPLTDPGSF
jgi:macrodomain Ter protein organizer (MatP/YcbG family)